MHTRNVTPNTNDGGEPDVRLEWGLRRRLRRALSGKGVMLVAS